MRAIVRFSVDNEANGLLRNQLNPILTGAGFQMRLNTATYEANGIPEDDLGHALEDFWTTASQHLGPGRVDHFWMYTDRDN
jgi:hypothetical protein